jgi:hypothetical protein
MMKRSRLKSEDSRIVLKFISLVCFSHFLFSACGFSQAWAAESKALLHIPWPLLANQLQNTIQDNGVLSGSPANGTLNAGGYLWNVTSTQVQAQVTAAPPVVNSSSVSVQITNAAIQVSIGQISVDQVITQNIGGITVNAHLQASCGPIQLSQASAQASSQFALTWTSGTPQIQLTSLTLGWPTTPWIVGTFTCEGPNGFGDLLHQQIAASLVDPAVLQPYLSQMLGNYISTQLESTLTKIRQPFPASTGNGTLPLQVGAFTPVATGVLADVSVGTPDPAHPLQPLPVPSAQVLAALSTSQPEILGGMDVINTVLNSDLSSRPTYTAVNLQTNSTFHSLMGNPLLQLLFWSDLWNYSSDSPFYAQIATPKNLAMTLGANGLLNTTFYLYVVMQSWRDQAWWNYVYVKGYTNAQVTLSVANGVLGYQTSIISPNEQISFGPDYIKKYGSSGSLPTSDINSALAGNQSALSGSVTWPVANLGLAGRYQVSSMRWLNSTMFSIPWSQVSAQGSSTGSTSPTH